MTNEERFRQALLAIRDSTFRSALQLRAIAERAIESAEPIPYRITDAGRKALEGNDGNN